MKTIMAILLISMLTPTVLFADTDYRDFNTAGLPTPDKRITIIPMDKMNLPEAMKKKQRANLAQQKSKGFIDAETSTPKYLLNIGRNGAEDINQNNDIYDTHMKFSDAQIKLGFPFKKVPGIDQKDIKGFAVEGTYIKNAGWTGMTEFFNYQDVGTCRYTIDNMKLSGGAVQIASEAVRYDVNKKPTDSYIQGSINSGFVYTVNWYDKTYRRTLECANMNYDKSILEKMINLAKTIDVQ